MVVAAHGKVDGYCAEHDMVIGERVEGGLEDYAGSCLVVVTDNCDSLNQYYYLKYKLRRRGIELVNTHWDSERLESFVEYLNENEKQERRKKYKGRPKFGERFANGKKVADETDMAVVRRIIKLRDAGMTYKGISEDMLVRRRDGRRLSVSTIQTILNNREKYGL